MFALEPCIYQYTIIIPIAVLPPLPEETNPRLVRPPFIVPAGHWDLVWNLVTIPYQLHPASFVPDGITLDDPLISCLIFNKSLPLSDTQWLTSVFTNAEELMTGVKYLINFNPPGDPERRTALSSKDPGVMTHDPTIVIAHDPVEPPTSGMPDLRAKGQTMET